MARPSIDKRLHATRVQPAVTPAARAVKWATRSKRITALAGRPATMGIDPASWAARASRFKKG